MIDLSCFKELKDRYVVMDLLNAHGLVGAAAEIGVMYGGYARTVLKEWKGQKYYCVDLWAPQDPTVYRERTDCVNFEQCYKDVQQLAQEDNRVVMIREDSVKAAEQIEFRSLDWVFIDGNHAYGPVLADMEAWWPKVKVGGVFSGHDYGLDTNYPAWVEVKPAVDRWMAERRIPFVIDKSGDSWWAVKEPNMHI